MSCLSQPACLRCAHCHLPQRLMVWVCRAETSSLWIPETLPVIASTFVSTWMSVGHRVNPERVKGSGAPAACCPATCPTGSPSWLKDMIASDCLNAHLNGHLCRPRYLPQWHICSVDDSAAAWKLGI